MTRLAKWILERRGYVVQSAAEYKVTLKVCESADKQLSRLVPRTHRGRPRVSGEPRPAEQARRAISQMMWVLRRALPKGAE